MTRLAENAHVEIEQIARSFESLFRKRAAACVQAVHETAGLIQGHLQTWRDTLCQQMERQLADLAVGCPPSFVRVAGQSHLEKPFNRLLAWLVDPLSDHGCGAAFLKLLALRVEFPELVEDLDLMATDSNWQIEIRAEQELDDDDSGKEPDLAIRTPRAALLLENKVGSPESGDQYAPYLVAFRRWAEPKRKTHAYLCARSERDVPKGWTGFLLHADLAEILYEVSRDKKGVSVWGRISAVMCATALVEASDHEKIRAARQILAETKITSVNTDQITRLREILPLPRPMTPWKELCDE
jgi:hypothetical protein